MARLSLVIDQETFDNTNTGFDPVPEADYRAVLFAVTLGEVKSGDNKGKPRLSIQFKILPGETAPDGTKVGNRSVFANINAFNGVSSKTGEPTPPFDVIAVAKALGQDASDLAKLDTDDWLGNELIITVKHEEKKQDVGGQWVSFDPKKYRDVAKGFRSVQSAEKSATAKATVNAGTGKKSYSL